MESKEKILIGKKIKKNSNFASQTGAKTASPLPSAQLVLLGDDHSGRDEMNLAGHPFALLQPPGRQSENELLSETPRTLPDGRLVSARWHVTTPTAYGLPGPNEELLYLVLLQLTREAAAGKEWPQKVTFSRYELLSRLDWNPNDLGYKKLELAFNRLSAVHIAAQHAFWDARRKAPYDSIAFGIISSYAISAETPGRKGQGHLPLSWFHWDEVLHTSFHAGNVRSLALDFAISLESPTSRRLFRLLELLRHADKPPRKSITLGLWKLRDRLGMSPYKYPSKIREKLAPAVQELCSRGYLEAFDVEMSKDGDPMAVFRFGSPLSPLMAHSGGETLKAPGKAPHAPPTEPGGPLRQILLPDFGPRSLLALELDDEDEQNRALDAIFAELAGDEQNSIEERVRASLAPFLRDNIGTAGARGEMARGRRREVKERFPDLLAAKLIA